MNGIIVAVVGALLCFYGIRSVHLGILAVGFGLGWLIAELLNASFWWLLLIGLIGAISSWVVTSLIFRFAAYFIGGLTGAMIGTKLAAVLQPEDKSWALSMTVALAVCVASAFLAQKFRARALLWLTSIGGASMVLSGVARMSDSLAFLREPEPGWQQVTATLGWVGLSVLGWITQRHLFAEKLGIEHLAGDDETDQRQSNGGAAAK